MTGIKLKLVLAFLLTTTLSLAAMAAFTLWSFDRGFLEYINAQEQAGLEPLREALSDYFTEEESWKEFRSSDRLWKQMHSEYLGNQPRRPEAGQWRRPPPRRSEPPGQPRGQPRGDGYPGEKPEGLASRLSLLDEGKNVLFGPPQNPGNRDPELIPIEAAGKIAGYLSLQPGSELHNRLDLGFVKQQSYRLLMISLAAIALCLLIAIPLAGQLVQPIRALLTATRELTAGNSGVRTEIFRRDELGQLSTDFNKLAETLEANERDRKQWVSDISHELRTPLAVIRGQTEAMLDGIRTPNEKELRLLNSKVLQLGALVDDLYELSLSDQGALNYQMEVVDICASLDDAIDDFSKKFESSNIALSCNIKSLDGYYLSADPSRMQQLWANLMTNTLRYTDSPGELRISGKIENESALITFSDTSPGVDEEALPQLFERLYRAEKSRGRATGGAGLGLSICKNIVSAHEGSIAAATSDLGGLSISVELALHTSAERKHL